MFDIVCSIVIYKTPIEDLKKVVQSILKSKLKLKIYIVDNSPNPIKINNYFTDDKIEYIFTGKNLGFGTAHNIAIKKAIQIRSQYHLVLNPDIYFDAGIIETIYKFMNANTDVGLLMPKILYPNGKNQYLPKLLPSPWNILKRKIPMPKKIYHLLNSNYELRFAPALLTYEVPLISGCFSFFRTEVFKKIGFYDERFFMYFEDFDISRRVRKHFKNVYFPNVFVYHAYERGAQKNLRLFRIYLSSLIKYFNKWGWFFDKERRITNKNILNIYKN